jgi:hypothetical protein
MLCDDVEVRSECFKLLAKLPELQANTIKIEVKERWTKLQITIEIDVER